MKNNTLKLLKSLAFKASIVIAICLLGCSSDPCEDVYCLNGYCDDGSCICEDGYSGSTCAVYDSCHDVLCENGGECDAGACDCPPLYTGESCEEHIINAISGTYVNAEDEESVSYHITVYGNLSTQRVSVTNLFNSGETLSGTMDAEGGVEFDQKEVLDYGCDAIMTIDGFIEPFEGGESIRIKLLRHIEYCQGNLTLSSSLWTQRFYLQSKQICQNSYTTNNGCDNNPASNFAGTYSYNSSKSTFPVFTGFTHPSLQVRSLSPSRIEIFDLLNNGKWTVADYTGHNEFAIAANQVIRMNNNPNSSYATPTARRVYFSPNGKDLIFQATLKRADGSYCCGGQYVFSR